MELNIPECFARQKDKARRRYRRGPDRRRSVGLGARVELLADTVFELVGIDGNLQSEAVDY
jgi:hypothetical protein